MMNLKKLVQKLIKEQNFHCFFKVELNSFFITQLQLKNNKKTIFKQIN